MAQILVRNLPTEVVRKLKMRARQHRRSLQEELKDILEEAAQQNVKGVQATVKQVASCLPAVSSVTVRT
jgi:plasmid stability protein